MHRQFDPTEPELMDRPQPVSAELARDLENLRRLNRWFGSYRLVKAFLRCWLQPGGNYRILDLATGYGDIPRMIATWAKARGCTVQIDAVDQQASTLELAQKASAGFPEIRYAQGDALSYTSPLTYDFVLCSLALHHFTETDAARLLRQARVLSHGNVLVADLERSTFTSLSIWLLTSTIFREPMTRHDARASVRRAFSYRELDQLAVAAGWEHFGHQRFFPARQAIWLRQQIQGVQPLTSGTQLDYAT
jgi:ubiquinone/menaquinone biosynthesis C-methylase UbiE